MGWQNDPWYTMTDDETDFGVDEWHGTNAYREGDDDLPHLPHQQARRRGDGSTWAYLTSPPSAARGVGGLPAGLPQTTVQWWTYHDAYSKEAQSRTTQAGDQY